MREKIVFFILGAVLATLAYFAGDMNDISALEEPAVLDKLTVDTLVAKKIIINKEGPDKSSIGMFIMDNKPYIYLDNRDGIKVNSRITMSAYSDKDTLLGSGGSSIILSGKNDRSEYTITNSGVLRD